MRLVKFNLRHFGPGIVLFLALPVVGCGGLSVSHSVSPASILLPGLLRADPAPQVPAGTPPAAVPGKELARS